LIKTEAVILIMDKLMSQKINDATGRLMQPCLMPTETTPGNMQMLHDQILTHSVPVALYGDKHNAFRTNAKDADPVPSYIFDVLVTPSFSKLMRRTQ
jgi:hypothetical protein